MTDTYDRADEDVRHDDLEFDPSLEPKRAKAWLNLLRESEDAFEEYNDHCDRIDKNLANLSNLSDMYRNKQFQLFWANAEVLKPSVYAKCPIPVVVPKFMDRRPVYSAAAEVMERCASVAFDLANIDELMKLVRDDLALLDRGVAWCRYESGKNKNSYYGHEKVCIDFKNRRDFLHSVARTWPEVEWVAAASYLTRAEARERFHASSGDEYQQAEYRVDKDSQEIGGADARERAQFWEVWCKSDRRVVWVSEGCENILDDDDPHLDLRGFFPCPRPAYGSVQRGSLVPVPDVLQYRDQLDEVNLLTGRIHALSDALSVKGFYPSGGSEIAEAIQAAITTNTPGTLLVPIKNWAAFGGTKDVIIWLPIADIASTITACVALRKQIIEDIYQIMGLSDIMRGSTDPNETLGAQQLKTQYGSTRIKDKQQEMVRLARDLVEITTEIITEKFDDVTIIEMSQTQLPTNRMVQQAVQQLMQQMQQMQMQMQQMAQMAQAQPPQPPAPGEDDPQKAMAEQAQMQLEDGQNKIDRLQAQPTIDQVLVFLRDNRIKRFVLDIETDSTIIPDEKSEKQSRTEFIGVLAQLIPQLAQMMTAEPQTAGFCGSVLQFATAPFRAGRSLDGEIDGLVEQMKAKGDQPRPEDPTTAQNRTALQIEQLKTQQRRESDQGKLQLQAQELQMKNQHEQARLANERAIKMAELQAKQGDEQSKMAVQNQKMMENREAHQAHMLENDQKMALDRQKGDLAMQTHQLRANESAQRHSLAQAAQAQKAQQGPIP